MYNVIYENSTHHIIRPICRHRQRTLRRPRGAGPDAAAMAGRPGGRPAARHRRPRGVPARPPARPHLPRVPPGRPPPARALRPAAPLARTAPAPCPRLAAPPAAGHGGLRPPARPPDAGPRLRRSRLHRPRHAPRPACPLPHARHTHAGLPQPAAAGSALCAGAAREGFEPPHKKQASVVLFCKKEPKNSCQFSGTTRPHCRA